MSDVDILNKWFAKNRNCGLILPDGWLGRPYDNIYSLESASENNTEMSIKLSESINLVISKPLVCRLESNDLFVVGSFKIILISQNFDSREYSGGTVRFVTVPG
jgi:hypothetical protein